VRAVLTYHSIDSSGSAISVSERDFRRHVSWLASGRVRVVPLEEIAIPGGDDNAVALTFDDAFQNFGTIAAPLLEEHSLPATLFVVTQRVGGTNAWRKPLAPTAIPVLPLLDWSGIAAVAQRGIAIGSHGRTHRALSSLDAGDLRDEVNGSSIDLRRELGITPSAFCYPYGDASTREREEAARLYGVAVTAELKALGDNDDVHMLPRLDAYYLREARRLERFGSPAFERYLRMRGRGRWLRKSVERLFGRDNG
jgi:peptidoglycan/xylan/chitin deacetylase (PgdA/CDA1 family)